MCERQLLAGKRPLAGPHLLHLRLLSHLEGIVDFDTEVADRALELRMSKQKLDCAEVLRSPVDQCRLRATHRVRSVCGVVQANRRDPAVNDPRILPSRDM